MSEASSADTENRAPPVADWRAPLKGMLEAIASPVRLLFGYFGEHALLLFQSLVWLFRRPFRPRLFMDQMQFVGVGSLPIILLVGFFSGAVAAQQAINALEI